MRAKEPKRVNETSSSCRFTVLIRVFGLWEKPCGAAQLSPGLSQLQIPLLFLSVSCSLSTLYSSCFFAFCPRIALFRSPSFAVSLPCPAPDLLPQFSVNLEFEINLISSDLGFILIVLPPFFCCIYFPSLPNSPLYSSVLFCTLPLPSVCSGWLSMSISPIVYSLFPSVSLTLCDSSIIRCNKSCF